MKMLWVVDLAFLHAKQLLMKLLFENLQTYANLLLELMRANYTPTRCVNHAHWSLYALGFRFRKE